MPITPLPTPVPTRADPANFAVRADAFLAALPTFATEANALEANVDAAEAVCLSVAQTVNVTAWSSVTSYAVGANVYDATTLLTYRRKTAGSGGLRPGLNGTDWQLLTGFGDVDSVSAQTIGGTKTFSSAIEGSITGNAATATNATNATNANTVTTITSTQVLSAIAAAAATSMGYSGVVGMYAFLYKSSGDYGPNDLTVGAALRWTSSARFAADDGFVYNTNVPTGTWRCLGYSVGVDGGNQALWLRIL